MSSLGYFEAVSKEIKKHSPPSPFKQEYTDHKFKLEALHSSVIRQINSDFCFYFTNISADFPKRLVQEKKAIIKDPYHTLLWGEKRFIFFPQKKQIGETFTTHINLQLVLTLSGTGVNLGALLE